MVTGDKLETAEATGYSTGMVPRDCHKLYLTDNDDPYITINNLLGEARALIVAGFKKCLILDGKKLTQVTKEATKVRNDFVALLRACESVIVCRATPNQKAEVVRIVKGAETGLTLAIGDGANDVAMIQEAHVGVGIIGMEGLRAMQSSDYALPEFRGIWKLLFVHGRWSYMRISELVLYFFYKNFVFTIPQLLFLFSSALSCLSVFDDFYLAFYNVLFTSVPVIVRAIFDQDLNYQKWTGSGFSSSLKERSNLKANYSRLYYMGYTEELFTGENFFFWIFQGICHGLLVYAMVYFVVGNNAIDTVGSTSDFWYFSITLYTVIVFVVNMKLALVTKFWTVFNWISISIFSIVLYVGYMWIEDSFSVFEPYKTCSKLFSSVPFYLLVFMMTVFVFVVELFVSVVLGDLAPTLKLVYMKIVRAKKEGTINLFEEVNQRFKIPLIVDEQTHNTLYYDPNGSKNIQADINIQRDVEMSNMKRSPFSAENSKSPTKN